MSEHVLEVDGLQKAFRVGAGNVVACNNVSFAIPPGGSMGLVGESGSGKSTIARMLVGLETPDAGTIHVRGRQLGTRERGRAARLRRAKEIQMVFQDPYGSLDRRLTVAQCLDQAMRLHGVSGSSRVAALLDQVGLLAKHGDSKPHQLSGGQRQRVAIARCLAIEPSVMVLDEAVSALDVSVQAQILALLNEIRSSSGIALLFVSHDLAVVSEVTDDVLVMYRGSILEQGPTGRVLNAPEHSYTKLLISSMPGPGWEPKDVLQRRAAFEAEVGV
ncbi:ATP-binding cassette domain-containing protein [Arthrobacter sp. D5-1]|uniref:ABC transporter ATP-binding protein n=1 Tax=Arthrobacter sp. D5-1 TaxID=1477518 RepID=UPI001A99BD59|nr:ATP-binding cassette domain-containing protein [Arthrobacter sp. D5-1]QSZ47102.1 ABC transporter ATP-binding protein [Arthrobacter sp. D5-1]